MQLTTFTASVAFQKSITSVFSPFQLNISPQPISNMITLSLITNQNGIAYVDGNQVLKTSALRAGWVNISDSFKVLAVKVNNKDSLVRTSFMAETSFGIVSDTTWKCTGNVTSQEWMNINFSDKSWLNAVPLDNEDKPAPFWTIWLKYSKNLRTKRQWISVQDTTVKKLYCRKKRFKKQ